METDMHGRTTVAGKTNDRSRRRSLWKGPASITALVLLIPLLGNHFVDGWNWNLGAFVVVGALIFGTGLTYALVTRNVDTIAYRSAVGVALVAAFLLVWVNFVQAADDVNPAALIYFGVPIVGLIGIAMARLRSNGMAVALFATAFAQALALATAVIRNPQAASWTSALWRGFGLNACFLILFAGSALLFRTAARGESAPGAIQPPS